MDTGDYQFSAKLPGVVGDKPEHFALLSFSKTNPAAIAQIRKVWTKLALALGGFHECIQEAKPHWVSWKLHEWVDRNDSIDRFVAWYDGCIAGYIAVQKEYKSPINSTQVPYVEHLITFPGDLDTKIWKRRLEAVGTALAGFVAWYSEVNGMNGRFALHSVPESEGFWNSLCKGEQTIYSVSQNGGVKGPHPINVSQLYLEVSEDGAKRFLGRFKNE